MPPTPVRVKQAMVSNREDKSTQSFTSRCSYCTIVYICVSAQWSWISFAYLACH